MNRDEILEFLKKYTLKELIEISDIIDELRMTHGFEEIEKLDTSKADDVIEMCRLLLKILPLRETSNSFGRIIEIIDPEYTCFEKFRTIDYETVLGYLDDVENEEEKLECALLVLDGIKKGYYGFIYDW